MSTIRSIAVLAVSAATVAALLTTSAAAPSLHRARPPANPDPKLFKHPQGNPYYPLTPGLVTRLRGAGDGEHFKQTVRITAKKRLVAGVETTVVRDVVRRPDGSLAEATDDWYAADNDGNVWYFGEDTATYDEDGNLESREGSWEAGVDGAVAGIIMPADPRPSTGRLHGVRQGRGRGPGLGGAAAAVRRHARRTVTTTSCAPWSGAGSNRTSCR